MVNIIGAACKLGQLKNGVQMAPLVLKDLINYQYNYHHINIKNTIGYYELFNCHSELHNPITIGGDHSISMATVGSSLQKHDNLKVLWIDAHADINTPKSSLTQNIHGMPVSTLLGQSNLMHIPVKLKRENLSYIGLRDIDDYEYKELETIRWYSSKCVHNQGVGKILKELNYSEDDKIHISLDVDALDPKYFPATGTPVENGLKTEHVYKIIHLLKKNIVSLDIVEYNPLINNNYECKRFILNCIRHTFR
jgi:arginase